MPLGSPVKKKAELVEPGSDKSALIILLTDGATNAGPDPVESARQAANHGVRVYTVGFGTARRRHPWALADGVCARSSMRNR